MDPFPTLPELLTVLSLGVGTLLAVVVGLLLYGYIADRVIFEDGGRLRTEKFGPLDMGIVVLLGTLLIVPLIEAIWSPTNAPDDKVASASQMVAGVVLSSVLLSAVVGGILGGLTLRNIPWREVFGLDRQGPIAVLGFAVLLLLAAFPLIQSASVIWQLLVAALVKPDNSSQELVRFLARSDSREARVVVGLTAVFVAPVLEETIFRGYLYGVVRRYAGVTSGIIFNSLLFAAIHQHLPSFGGLFVLAVCLSLAYEWTGSIFVTMTMHALFNMFSVVQLLHGGVSGASFHAH